MDRPTTIWKPAHTGNYESGRRSPISRITYHHIVGDAPAALQRFQNTTDGVSANYIIGSDGTIYQCVQDQDTAYCDGNYDSNSRTISIEHAGGIDSVSYTDAMYDASIKLCAYLIDIYGIKDFKRHRDVIDTNYYPGGTSCPGNLDVERIINAVNNLLEEPMFNEGDRKNWNSILYGEDLGYHKDLVDKVPFKEALENIRTSPEFLNITRTNRGDLDNELRFFAGHAPNDNDYAYHVGKLTHKQTIYDLMSRSDVKVHQGGSVNRDSVLDYINKNLK